jgi:aryl-alcohol dehydrogenase-like predicted oxidoreductase
LKALRTDWIDLLLIHEPQVADIGQLLNLRKWLKLQKVSGRVRYLGLAGGASNCVTIAQQMPGLFDVLQVEDSLAGHEADKVTAAGWSLQITFGYIRAATTQDGLDAGAVVKDALTRNSDGMVLVSSRNPDRLKMLASLVGVDGTQLC